MSERKSRTILVVDDDESVRDVLRRQLESQGHRVYSAENGRQALNVIAWRRPDLVLLDIDMPVMDGWTAMRTLRQTRETRTLPVIVLTSLSHPEDEIEALDSGADAFVSKPFLAPELQARMAAVLA